MKLKLFFVLVGIVVNIFASDSIIVKSATHNSFVKISKPDSLFYALGWEEEESLSVPILKIPENDINDTTVNWNCYPLAMIGGVKTNNGWWGIIVIASRKYLNPYAAEYRKDDTLWYITFKDGRMKKKELVTTLKSYSTLQHFHNESVCEVKFWTAPSFFTITTIEHYNFPGGYGNIGSIIFYYFREDSDILNEKFEVYKSGEELIDSVYFVGPEDYNLMTSEFKVRIQTDKNLHYYYGKLFSSVCVQNNSLKSDISFYYNSRILKFKLDRSSNVRINIFNLSGRKIYSLNIEKAVKIGSIDITSLVSGQYICSFQIENLKKSIKILVK